MVAIKTYPERLAAYELNPIGEPPVLLETPTKHPMGQWDFFNALTKTKQNINEIKLQYIAQEDAEGKMNK